MMKHTLPARFWATAVLLAMLASTSAAGWAQDAPLLRIATLPSDNGAQVYYAKDLGLFAKAGLNVEIQPIQNSSASASAVLANATDISYGTLVPLAIAHIKNIPFVVVAPAVVYTSAAPNSALLVAVNSPIRTAKDLAGKTIGINGVGNISEFGPRAWIDQDGGDSNAVRFLELPYSEMAVALGAGRIDAAWLTEPFLSSTKRNGRVLATAFDAISKEFLVGIWFTSAPWAKDHPDLVKRFAAVMREAALWANKNQAQSAAILVKYTKIDPAVVATTVRSRYAEQLTGSLMQPVIDVTAKYAKFAPFPAGELIYIPPR
jgi:ABC-type nitrate/sulfonate/bicarbonate transport system substrate-binding protein